MTSATVAVADPAFGYAYALDGVDQGHRLAVQHGLMGGKDGWARHCNVSGLPMGGILVSFPRLTVFTTYIPDDAGAKVTRGE